MTGRLVDMAFTLGGKQRVTLEINGDFREIWDKLHQESVLDVEIKKHREKRSLSANAYFHVLCNKISAETGESEDAVKRRLVVSYGALARDKDGKPVGLKLPPTVDPSDFYPYVRLYETRQENGKDYSCYFVYKESHKMDAYTKDEINAKISAVYKPAGSVAFAELPSLSESILGNVYNVTDAFTTTANFVEGAGNKYPKGTNVVVVKVGDAYKYDVLAGFVDLSGYVEKEAGKGLSDENFTAALKDKLDGIAAGANKYVHPTHTAAASGLYKTTVDEEGHVTATTPVTKDDITNLGIPAQDTTYDEATTAKAGLMSAADKTKLDGMGATINKAIADHTATDAEVSEMLAEVYGE